MKIKNKKIGVGIIGLFSLFLLTNISLAADDVPEAIQQFLYDNNLAMTPVTPIVNKYPISGKTIKVTGKLTVSGKVTYLGRVYPFTAPGSNNSIWDQTYVIGQKKSDGTLPFTLKRSGIATTGIMTPIKADTYSLNLSNKYGSLLYAMATLGQKSGTSVWKNTAYSYQAGVVIKPVSGVNTKFFVVTEKASFQFNLLALAGATGVYTYSYTWSAKI